MNEVLVEVALDLASNLPTQDRYSALLRAARRLVPFEAASLMHLEGETLVPLAVDGLKPEVMGRRFNVADHPRLQRILASSEPVRFRGSALPDPFDGLLLGHDEPLQTVHACVGCSLRAQGEVVGVLTLDSSNPTALDGVEDLELALLGALAGATIRTARMMEALEDAARRQGLVANQLLAEAEQRRGGELLGMSAAMRHVRAEIELLSISELPVLVLGETGVGKELVARAIHAQSPRARQPLIYVNCAALPESIAESELFGHVRGAFTGAHEQRAGKFEAADGGTLFLDEVGELPINVQPKLLRALQSGEVQRVGSEKHLKVNVRILAATNRNLSEEVATGRFRADLYHRLSVYPVTVSPLRQRPEDIPVLTAFFLDNARHRLGLGPVRLTPQAEHALTTYPWPGNVRELEHLILAATLRASGGQRRVPVLVGIQHLGGMEGGVAPQPAAAAPVLSAAFAPCSLRDTTDDMQRQLIVGALRAHDGCWARAAAALQLDRSNLHRLAHRLGVQLTSRGVDVVAVRP